MRYYLCRLILLFLGLCAATLPGFSARAERETGAASVDSQLAPDGAVSQPPPALAARLQARGFSLGAPVFIRIFKEQSRLELWMANGGRYALFAAYPVCRWSGQLGPKILEGDRQSPEGVYFISAHNLRINARWRRAMGVNFPNAYDRVQGRTGSGILIHGKCSSRGCFALTDHYVEEVYDIVAAALGAGQMRAPVHIFPFIMSTGRLAGRRQDEWFDFWRNLKKGFDLFERDRLPPRTLVCGGHYVFKSRRGGKSDKPAAAADCAPLYSAGVAVAAAGPKRQPRPAASQPLQQVPQTPQARAQGCNPKDAQCRLLRLALKAAVPCPKKYARCRIAHVAAIKSIDCPLKFPRCRKSRAARIATASQRR